MSNIIVSPNMGLPVPVTGQEAGPTYANDVNNSLNIIDSHTHSAGSGVPVTPAGLNLNSDLSFLSNNAVSLRSTRYTLQNSPLAGGLDLACAYVSGVDLWFNDANGNQIQITQNGGIAGTSGSISNLTAPASASYVSGSKTFIWQSAASTPANMDFASAVFRNLLPGSNGVTVSAPSALGSNYTIVLPLLPAQQQLMTLDAGGNMAAPYAVDTSTMSTASNLLGVKAAGITSVQLATPNFQKSASSVNYNSTSATPVLITNFSVTVAASGTRPIRIFCQPDGSNNPTGFGINSGAPANLSATVYLEDGIGTVIAVWQFGQQNSTNITQSSAYIDFTDYNVIGTPGNYTYQLLVAVAAGQTFSVTQLVLVAEEA